jgi:MFS family permease
MSISAFGSLWGPVLGPVAGGFLSEAEGWRWIFWVITNPNNPYRCFYA